MICWDLPEQAGILCFNLSSILYNCPVMAKTSQKFVFIDLPFTTIYNHYLILVEPFAAACPWRSLCFRTQGARLFYLNSSARVRMFITHVDLRPQVFILELWIFWRSANSGGVEMKIGDSVGLNHRCRYSLCFPPKLDIIWICCCYLLNELFCYCSLHKLIYIEISVLARAQITNYTTLHINYEFAMLLNCI